MRKLLALFIWLALCLGAQAQTTIYGNVFTGNNTGNGNSNTRQAVVVSGPGGSAGNQILIATVGIGTTGGNLTVTKVSACKQSATSTCTTTPVELLCSGGHGYTITGAVGTSTVTCQANISGTFSFLNGDTVLICQDISTDALGQVSLTGAVFYFSSPNTSDCGNTSMAGSITPLSNLVLGLAQLQTQAASAAGGGGLMNLGVGQ